jgi:hypothetical protein
MQSDKAWIRRLGEDRVGCLGEIRVSRSGKSR